MNDAESVYNEAMALEESPAQGALLERAIQLADAEPNLDVQIDARLEYIRCVTFLGHIERGLVALSWVSNHFDKHPDDLNWYREYRHLWYFKWACCNAPSFPNIPRDRIEDMLNDYARRLGEGEARAIAYVRGKVELEMGDKGGLARSRIGFERHPSSMQADCPACETDFHVEAHVMLGEFEDALKKAEPILSGHQSCAEIPHFTYGHLLEVWRANGDEKAAEAGVKKAVRLTRKQGDWVHIHAKILLHYALTDRVRSGLPFLERTIGFALDCKKITERVHYADAAARMLARAKPSRTMRLSRFANVPLDDQPAKDLLARFQAEASTFAAALDARNGNDYYASLIKT